MKQRDYEKVCEHLSVTCAFLSAKFEVENNKKMANKLQRLAFKFNKLKDIKINLKQEFLTKIRGMK